tara:strand:+ start:553 stop:732 length:180 start_codon:yes stop_codon:yes gene_type:complete
MCGHGLSPERIEKLALFTKFDLHDFRHPLRLAAKLDEQFLAFGNPLRQGFWGPDTQNFF